ncbi:MAG: hypothetical protein VX498_12440, partial [Myxococcota bacterium]|nr:hypothetical protein [Myxococcota bacterium]
LSRLVAEWTEGGEAPAQAAVEELQRLAKRLSESEEAEGMRLGVAGPAMTSQTLERLFPPSLLRALLALALLAGMAVFFLRRRVVPALAVGVLGPVVFGLSLGLYAALGFSMNPNTAVLAFLGAWAAVSWGVARTESGGGKLVVLVAWGCPLALAALLALGATAGGGAGLVCLLVASLAAAVLASPPSPALVGLHGRSVPGLALALVLVLVGGGLALQQAPGLDPSRMLASSEEGGWPARVLGRAMGTVPMGYLVVDARGSSDRPFADPANLAILREAQEELQAEVGVRAAVSWSDFVAEIHARVAGVETGALPSTRAAVEQYLLLFGRPDETRVLVSTGLDLGLVLVRSRYGEGARLASLAEPKPRGLPVVALGGDAMVMMVAARSQSIRIALFGGLLLALMALVLPLPAGSPGALRLLRFVGVAASLSCALALSGVVEAALTPTALFGALAVGGLVGASWSWNFRAALSTLGVGAASACGLLASPVLALRGLGLVLLAGCVVGWLLRLVVTRTQPLP